MTLFIRTSLFITLLLLIENTSLNAQITSCNTNSNFVFTPTTQTKVIEWDKFPVFSLPFKIIYNGPRFGDTQRKPLQHGFSHLATFNNDFDLPFENRAIIMYGGAGADGKQPWETIRSPWGNNMNLYYSKWGEYLSIYGDLFRETAGQKKINADLFLIDIERQWKTNDSILILKNNTLIPKTYQVLDNQAFLTQYKKDMQALYAEPVNFFKNNSLSNNTKISSYADTPIGNTFVNIIGNNWQKWKSDASLLNYLTYDFSKNTIGGSFYNSLDYLTPSAYYYYDYPNPFASDYLAYLLFQVEVNRAWSSKPIIPFIWLKYSTGDWNNPPAYAKKFLKPWMIEATAIFPFFSGANGLWVWEDPTTFGDPIVYDGYERFIHALYRLSNYKDMFTGSYELIIETPARDYFDTPKPIWRGVAKGNEVLIVAHNPYAKSDTELSQVTVNYKNWSQTLTLKGYEVFLCKYDRSVQATENQYIIDAITLYPNPSSEFLSIDFVAAKAAQTTLSMSNSIGQNMLQEEIEVLAGKNTKTLKINTLPNGKYFIRIGNAVKSFVKE